MQNGANVAGAEGNDFLPVPNKDGTPSGAPIFRFIATPRDMATYVHFDALYEGNLSCDPLPAGHLTTVLAFLLCLTPSLKLKRNIFLFVPFYSVVFLFLPWHASAYLNACFALLADKVPFDKGLPFGGLDEARERTGIHQPLLSM